MLNSLIFGSNKKITNWILTRISSENIEPFDTKLEPPMSNLANVRVTLKFNNPVLVQKSYSSLYSNFILSLYIVYEWNKWPRNPTNNFTLKNCLFGTVKLTRSAEKSKFSYNGWGRVLDGKSMWWFC